MNEHRFGLSLVPACAAMALVFLLAACSGDKEPVESVSQALPGQVTVSGRVTTSSGTSLPGMQLTFGTVSTATTSNGSYSLEVSPGNFVVTVRNVGPIEFSTGLLDAHGLAITSSFSTSLSSQVTISAATTMDVVIPTRVVRGLVQDSSGQPLTGGSVSASAWAMNAFLTDGGLMPWYGRATNLATQIDPTGHFQLVVLAGTGDITVNPAVGSGMTPITFPQPATEDVDITVRFPAPVAIGGKVTTSDGLGISGLPVNVGNVTTQTDSTGTYSLFVTPGQTNLCVGGTTPVQVPTGLTGSAGSAITSAIAFSACCTYSVSAAMTINPALPTRVISGIVRSSSGTPVPGAAIKVTNWTVPTNPGVGTWSGSQREASTTSDATGRYRLYVLAGTGTLVVTPATGSGLPPVQTTVTATSDVEVNPSLPQAALISGTVSLPDGTPLAGQGVSMGLASASSDSAGKYTLAVALGSGTLSVSNGSTSLKLPTGLTANGQPSGTPLYSELNYTMSRSLTVTGDTQMDVQIPTRVWSGTVRDPDGAIIACGTMTAGPGWTINLGGADGGTDTWGGTVNLARTSCNTKGEFHLVLTVGSGLVSVVPPSATGLGTATYQLSLTDDKQQDLTLQFMSGKWDQLLPAGGGTMTTARSTGATLSDPVTTTVVSPVQGLVVVRELPVNPQATTPPSGYTFLTQEVQIEAPTVPGATTPLAITFVLDSSRIPAGRAGDIKMARNGVLVPVCTGTTGTAAPDPCESARQVLSTGDLQITILTTQAGLWHFALAATPGTGGTGGGGSSGSAGATGSWGGAAGATAGAAGNAGSPSSGGATGGTSSSSSAGNAAGATGTGGAGGTAGLGGGSALGDAGLTNQATPDAATAPSIDASADRALSLRDDGSIGPQDAGTSPGLADAAPAPDEDGGLAEADAGTSEDSNSMAADAPLVDASTWSRGDAALADARASSSIDARVGDASRDVPTRGRDATTDATTENAGESGCGCDLGRRPRSSLPALGWILALALVTLANRRRI